MAEGNVGARLTLIGKSAFLAGIKEARDAAVKADRDMAAAAQASTDTQVKGYATLAEAHAAYQAKTSAANAKSMASYEAFGRKAAFGLGAASLVVGYESLKIHSQFQAAMTQVSTLAGVSQDRLSALTKGIKTLSPQVDQGLTPLANALYRIASTPAGLKATNAQLLNMTKYAGMLATIGGPGTDLEQTARIIGGAMSVGAKGTGSPKNIVSLAAATVGSGDIRMSDFVDFLGTGVLTSGKLTGIPIQQMAAFLALAGANLQSGQVSGHALAHGLQLMFAPTPQAQKALGVLGLGATSLADTGRNKGLGAAIHQLGGALEKPLPSSASGQLSKFGFSSSDIQGATTVGLGAMGAHGQSLQNLILTRMFGGAKMGIPLDMLVSQSGNYNQILAHMQKSMGNFPKAWAQQTGTLAFKTGAFTKSLANLADTIGTTLTPMAETFLTVATKVADVLGRNKFLAGGLAVVMGGILGPAIALYGIRKMSDMSRAIADTVRGFAGAIRAVLRFVGILGVDDAALAVNDRALKVNSGDQAVNDATRSGGAGVLSKLGLAGAYAGTAAAALYAGNALHHEGTLPGNWISRSGRWLTGHLHLPNPTYGPDGYAEGTSDSHYNADGSLKRKYLRAHPGIPILAPGSNFTGHLNTGTSQVPHIHVYIDGKEVFKSVQKQSKKVVARN